MLKVGVVILLLGLPLNPAPLVVGLVTFAVYTNDRIADSETDAFSNPDKAAFIAKYDHILQPFADIAYGVAVMVAIVGGPVALLLTLLPGIFWILYASDSFTALGESLYRLKEMLIVNTIVVALAWALVLTLLPLTFTTANVTVGGVLVCAYFFLRVFSYVEISNIPDEEGDRRIGVNTIPVVFGIDGTRRALYLVNGLTVVVVTALLVLGDLPPQVVFALFAGVGYALVVATCVGRWNNVSALVQAAECENVLTFLVLLVVLA